MHRNRKRNTVAQISVSASMLVIGLCSLPAMGQNYQFGFQHQVGELATFNVSGPATGSNPDRQGDAVLNTVEYPSGDAFIHFYKPVDVSDIEYDGNASSWRVRGGDNCTIGLTGYYKLSSVGLESFHDLMLTAFRNNNLNNYLDAGSGISFSFIIEFDLVVKDNDPDPDDFGEILYFERGSGNGNSWLKIQAVDENGAPLGPWLVIGPNETVQTTPVTTVKSGQTIGTTAIDVSRLGVSEFKYLRVSNRMEDDDDDDDDEDEDDDDDDDDDDEESAYTGGGDTRPDFKIMAVMTNQAQLAEFVQYD